MASGEAMTTLLVGYRLHNEEANGPTVWRSSRSGEQSMTSLTAIRVTWPRLLLLQLERVYWWRMHARAHAHTRSLARPITAISDFTTAPRDDDEAAASYRLAAVARPAGLVRPTSRSRHTLVA